ncbi:MAG: aminoacyl-tRNA hydrolase [Planctomycetota bacterium]
MKLLVGLGNPGREYAQTRHNVGFEAIDVLAERLAWTPAGDFDRLARQRFQSLTFEGTLDTSTGSEKLLLMKPITFMNLSGRAVKEAMSFYKLTPADLLVIVDELALPVGKLRLRKDGSPGGHNGLKDIQRALGTPEYARLRVGIDPAPPPVAGKDYVLGKFSPEQRIKIDNALPKAAACCVTWVEHGVMRAMNEFNG